MFRMGTDLEALDIIPFGEPLTSIVNHCVLSNLIKRYYICAFPIPFQTLNRFQTEPVCTSPARL